MNHLIPHELPQRFAFWGTPAFSVTVLDALKQRGMYPALIVTAADTPQGRRMALTPPPVKVWAEAENIPFVQPERIDEVFADFLREQKIDLSLVAAYGKILPTAVLDAPSCHSLNIHPSLLPKHRGAAPIVATILEDAAPGVTLIEMDEKMDHGPIVAQAKIEIEPWPPRLTELETALAIKGATLFADTADLWCTGAHTATPQEHENATFTKKIKKEDAYIDLSATPQENLRKIRAFERWPRAYTYYPDRTGALHRIIITDATIENGELVMTRVIPEGKREMSFEAFLRGIPHS